MTDSTYTRAVDLMEADIGDELVALDPENGSCFGFNSVARDIWRSLDHPRTFGELRTLLLEAYDVTVEECSADLREVLDDMLSRGLLAKS